MNDRRRIGKTDKLTGKTVIPRGLGKIRWNLATLAQRHDMDIRFLNFKSYYPKHENRLIKFLRTRRESIQIPILNNEGTLNSERVDIKFSRSHILTKKFLHNFPPIRFVSNAIYNILKGDDITLVAILTKT